MRNILDRIFWKGTSPVVRFFDRLCLFWTGVSSPSQIYHIGMLICTIPLWLVVLNEINTNLDGNEIQAGITITITSVITFLIVRVGWEKELK